MFDWNDLKHFLAVARHGSTTAAGRALGVSQSTVQRRLMELERRLGQALVVRNPQGYRLTPFGLALRAHAERVEEAVRGLERHVDDTARLASGSLRLTCPEPIVYRLSAFIERFHEQHPQYRVEFVTSDRYLDLLAGEADVALRSGDTEDDLIGRKVADSIWAVYGSRAYVERRGVPASVADLARHDLVGFDAGMSAHRVSRWLNEAFPGARIVARNSSVLGLIVAVRSGVGIGPLPTAVADEAPDLVRLLGPIPELSRSWRILTTLELRTTPRVSAFFDFVAAERDMLRRILTG